MMLWQFVSCATLETTYSKMLSHVMDGIECVYINTLTSARHLISYCFFGLT